MQTIQNSNQVEGLLRPNRISEKKLLAVLEQTDRTQYLPSNLAHLAGTDAPIPLGNARGLASPLTLAHLIQYLNVQEGQHILILAGNTGYSAAVCAALVGPSGHVTVVEDTPEFLPLLKTNLEHFANVTIVTANPSTYAGTKDADAVLLDATIRNLPAQAIGWMKDTGILATLQIQPAGLPGAMLYRKHGKVLLAEVMFDVKGQTQDIEDSRFTTPETFSF